MSASPTRIEVPPPPVVADPTAPKVATADPAFPLNAGNRVLESLAQRQTLPALLAFSALHEQIRRAPEAAQASGSNSDLLQTERFVLDEVLQLFCDHALSITRADGIIVALSEGSALVCRSGSGPLAVERGVHLVPDSELLQDSLDSGQIFSSDDCAVDARAELDLSRLLCARSTVIVPLRGSREALGVLQAFAQRPFAFSDDDIRTFDLFRELLLSALKPKDQDRRLNWLANVADQVLVPKPRAIPVPEKTAEVAIVEPPELPHEKSRDEESRDEESLVPAQPDIPSEIPEESFIPTLTIQPPASREFQPGDHELSRSFPIHFSIPISSRPGLSGVLALIAVAALFSAGVWWGMRNHPAITKSTNVAATEPSKQQPETASANSSTAPDHLLDSPNPDVQNATTPSAPATQLAVLPKITGVRHWSSSMGSTVVIDMEDQVPYEVHRLTSPERIYFDLHDTALVPDLAGKTLDVSDPSLTRVRVAQPVAGVTRVVLDTRNGSNFAVSMETNPYRLVVELRDSATTKLATRMGPLNSNPRTRSTAPALLPQTSKREDDQLKASIGRFRIVLDAGHGGWDLGTVGHDGLLEKDLVLDVTARLGKLLKDRLGADVIFTRTNDDYLPLEQRADIANQAQADLFVSVHANYSNVASARGVETYYTNFFSPPGSREIEKRENGTSTPPTAVALSASELHEKIEESRQLAASVQRSLYATLASRSPGIRDRGVRNSQFVVLTGTTMPAILTEVSFVSSPADERNLQSEAYRQQIAEALYKGITHYQSSAHHHVKMAQVGSASASR